ncbi:MAG: class II glutamine amidotransferase [Rhodospirillaceae bacterium]|nr:class II glutamine amidotransferase [Rhodospirillaceae bacterium]
MMCELFGMSARHPTDVNHSLALLRPRGGEIGPHSDGWGVAFYEGRAARVFKEPVPAAESRCLAFISEYDFQSTTVVAHIRKANPAEIGRASANTHPFERELCGCSWVFAHNGKLPGMRDDPGLTPRRFLPMGDTDSEYAFCLLLDAIAEHGDSACAFSPADFVTRIDRLVEQLAGFGEFNFMLSDGDHLTAPVHSRLHLLRRTCDQEDCQQEVVLLATSPLTDEPWVPLIPGSLYVFAHGTELARKAVSSPLETVSQSPKFENEEMCA